MADGFSCRTQIEESTGRAPLHVAELLRLALRVEGRVGGPEPTAVPSRAHALATAAIVLGMTAGGAGLWMRVRRTS